MLKDRAAFFDVDETIIKVKSMFSFYDFWCKEKNHEEKLKSYMACFKKDVKSGKSRERLNLECYQNFAGENFDELMDSGNRWFKSINSNSLFINKVVEDLHWHQSNGHSVIFVSGSMYPILHPIAEFLGVKDILGAPLIVKPTGELTGELGAPQTIGVGKKMALLTYCQEKGINPADCYAYGDDVTDIPMLESTGYPICVGNNPGLVEYANSKRWGFI